MGGGYGGRARVKDGHGWIKGTEHWIPKESTIKAYDSKIKDKIMAEQHKFPKIHSLTKYTQHMSVHRTPTRASDMSRCRAVVQMSWHSPLLAP